MRTNAILAAVAGALVALSAWSYVSSTTRAERFARGQRFLPNLDPDTVAGIVLEKGEGATRLERDGDRFVLPDEGGYPAKNEAVNRFLRDLLQIELDQDVGSGDDLAADVGLIGEENADARTTIALLDERDADMVRFVAVDAAGDVGGSYVRRLDETGGGRIYRTSKRIYLQTGADAYLDQEILNVERDSIASIRGGDFDFARAVDEETGEATGDLVLADLGDDEKETARANQLKTLLQGLRFQKHHLADSEEVADLRFDAGLTYALTDGSGYELQVATEGEKHYLRIRGTYDAAPTTIALDADEDEVRETSERLSRADEIRDFNAFHGSWIYEVTEVTAEKLRRTRDELVEDA